MAEDRLGRDDWIDAALAALLEDGPDAVAVQPIARRLGATKGSFYWHFTSRDDLLRAALARWEKVATEDVIEAIESRGGSASERAQRLFALVTASSERDPGQLLLLAGAAHPDISSTLQRVTARRIEYISDLLRQAGLSSTVARRRATLAYATYLGHAQLVETTPSVLPNSSRARRQLLEEMAEVALRG